MIELLMGYLYVLLYIAILVPGLLLVRLKTRIADEVFRKLLHCVLLGIIPVWLYVYEHWWIAGAACVGLVALLFPVLTLAERVSWCSKLLIERKKGEFKSSLILVFVMFAVVIAVCWGLFDDKWLALAGIYAWGPGDAAAALVGKRFGRHKIGMKPIAGKKSVEGTAAMFLTSFVCVLAILLIRGGVDVWSCVLISLAAALVSAVVELLSRNGSDTITCPIAATLSLILMLTVTGGLS